MIFIMVENYPSIENKYAMAYVHSRNLYYQKDGLEVIVINFKTKEEYFYEGIRVIPSDMLNEVLPLSSRSNIFISHAPNLKNHVRFIMKNIKLIKNIIFVFHGHEILRVSEYYPKAYDFLNISSKGNYVKGIYDDIKLKFLNVFFKKINKSKRMIAFFVSEWMKSEGQKNLKLDFKEHKIKNYIISNNAHHIFQENSYFEDRDNRVTTLNYKGDFISIRPFDNSKYAVDIIVELAFKFPHLKFDLYGEGEYFKYNLKPDNLNIVNKYFSPLEMPELLRNYKAALMPTRLDSQGVMMCEFATFGIPLVTSDIYICKEMLNGFKNVAFFNNESLDINLDDFLESIQKSNYKNMRFSNENTVQKEIEILKEILKGDKNE